MYEIKANIADVRAAAAEIQTQASIIRNEVGQIEGILDNLKLTFLGDRAADFFQNFNTAREQMDAWDEIVMSFAQELEEAAARYQAADQPN